MMNKLLLFCSLFHFCFNVDAFLTPINHHHNALTETPIIQLRNHPVFDRCDSISTTDCLITTDNYELGHRNQYSMTSLRKSEKHLNLMRLMSKKQNNNDDGVTNNKQPLSFSDRMREKPGTLIFYPIVGIFFLDIVANILVVAKRTIEYIFTGQYTVWHF